MIKTCLFFFLFSLPLCVEGKVLHSILVGDSSRAEWLSSSTIAKDVENMRLTVDLIAQEAKMTPQISILVGSRIYHSSIMKILKSLEIGEDDVVIFYFKGYGYRTANKKGDFPYIYLGGEKVGVEFYDMCLEILDKGPRLFLGIADCTNFSLPSYLAPSIKKGDPSFLPACDVSRGFQKLFLDFSGSIFLSACAPESRYDYSYRDGGSFFKVFLQSLLFEVYNQELADWNILLTKMSQELYDVSEEFHQTMLIDLRPSSINSK